MLFYEPLFLFVFFPTFYLIYLLGERREEVRRGVILIASVLFYTWSEPLFVPLVVASAVSDHLIAKRIDGLSAPVAASQLPLAVGVIVNLGILVHYRYHAVSDREPEWDPARTSGQSDPRAVHHFTGRGLVHCFREDHLSR